MMVSIHPLCTQDNAHTSKHVCLIHSCGRHKHTPVLKRILTKRLNVALTAFNDPQELPGEKQQVSKKAIIRCCDANCNQIPPLVGSASCRCGIGALDGESIDIGAILLDDSDPPCGEHMRKSISGQRLHTGAINTQTYAHPHPH